MKNLIYISVLFLVPSFIFAEEIIDNTTDTLQTSDTLLFDAAGKLDHIIPVDNSINYEEHLSQTPTKALFKSMLIPGWGQLGNKRKTKAVFFFALDAWSILSAVHYGSQASDFKKKFNSIDDPLLDNLKRDYYSLYLDRKDERNKYTWYAVIVSFFSMFDAFVDAHLSGTPDREERKKFTVNFAPDKNNNIAVKLSLNF